MASRKRLQQKTSSGQLRKKPIENHIDFEPRISKQELQILYGVDRITINKWEEEKGLPLINLGNKRYVRKCDLIKWENSFIQTQNKFGKSK